MIQLDVVGAFLSGELEEEIYLAQPEGFIDKQHPNHVWRLNASIYSLKQLARQWHRCLADQLKSIGFFTAQVDPLMYILHQDDKIVSIILVHVDNIFLAGTSSKVKHIKELLHSKFQITRNEDILNFLSFDISRDRPVKTFTMNQASYVCDLVKTYHLENACPVHTPCHNSFKNSGKSKVTHHPHCSLIGALLWLLNGTHPDITFAVN